ncbi:MAG: leucine-rich repeat domain-containing protein [Nitrospinae bacterium]|nr:leucine-rich repeat domain-containing protein [Nitrospinota bacterium]
MMDWNGIILNENGVLLAGLFADANLQNCVNNAFPAATYAHEVTGTLSCNNMSIVSLAGMESLTGLTALQYGTNQIVDVSPLAGLTNLTGLSLYGNQIVDVSPLAGLSNLTNLELSVNQIVDVSPLTGMTNLTTLAITNNRIVDVSPLAALTNLAWLYLGNNLIGGQGVGQVDSLVTLTGANLLLANNLGMSCAEATTLIGALGTSVDISANGVGALDTPTNGVNCTSP